MWRDTNKYDHGEKIYKKRRYTGTYKVLYTSTQKVGKSNETSEMTG